MSRCFSIRERRSAAWGSTQTIGLAVHRQSSFESRECREDGWDSPQHAGFESHFDTVVIAASGATGRANQRTLVGPAGLEPATPCLEAIEDLSIPSICSYGFQQFGASAFAQPTSPEGSIRPVLIR